MDFREGDLVLKDQMLAGSQHSANKVLEIEDINLGFTVLVVSLFWFSGFLLFCLLFCRLTV